MKHLEEKHVSKRKIYDGRLLNFREDTVTLPDGRKAKREVVEHPGAVAIIAITQDKEIVLVRQYRKPAEQIMLEIPAGVPHKAEALDLAALRELEEETGYQGKSAKLVFSAFATPGYSDEVIHYYLIKDMLQVKAHPDQDEFVEVDLIDLEAAVDLVKNKKINDNKTIIGILIAEMVGKGEL